MSGNLFIISAPSGTGKSSISAMACSKGEISLSVSCTTRPPRQSESEGVAYHFMDEGAFFRKRDAGELLEHAEVHGHWYGTPRALVEEQLAAGKDMLLEIDWKGARQVREIIPEAISVFVLPPSLEQLQLRLQGRAQDKAEVIGDRMRAAPDEISHAVEYDYVIINKDLQESVEAFLTIIRASRHRRSSMQDAVSGIIGEPTSK